MYVYLHKKFMFLKGCIFQSPWPRTPTEKMLTDMFEGSSAQMMAILEALGDSNRRTFHTSLPASENEPEIFDVCAELFMAAQEILAGGVVILAVKFCKVVSQKNFFWTQV